MTDSPAGRRGGTRPLRLRHRADPSELRSIRRRVSRWAEQCGVPEDVLADLQLALGEAVANGVEHAYGPAEAGTVAVDLEIRSGAERAVLVRVVDHGRWRPAPESSGYRGRGIRLIRRLADRVEVTATTVGTQVCFEIPFPA